MKIESAFVCDDVRQEGNGKLIFVGAYSQDILLPMFPVGLSLQVVLCVRFDKRSTFDLEAEAFIDDKRLLKGNLKVNNTVEGFGFVHLPLPVPKIDGPGILRVQVREANAKWNEVIKIELKAANPNVHPNNSPPPS